MKSHGRCVECRGEIRFHLVWGWVGHAWGCLRHGRGPGASSDWSGIGIEREATGR